MRIVLDTNVFVSGPPSRILEAWRDGRTELAVSPDILSERQRVGNELPKQLHSIDLSFILGLVTMHAMMLQDTSIACAMASKSNVIVNGGKHLLNVAEFGGAPFTKSREFADAFLSKS